MNIYFADEYLFNSDTVIVAECPVNKETDKYYYIKACLPSGCRSRISKAEAHLTPAAALESYIRDKTISMMQVEERLTRLRKHLESAKAKLQEVNLNG